MYSAVKILDDLTTAATIEVVEDALNTFYCTGYIQGYIDAYRLTVALGGGRNLILLRALN